MTHTTEPHYKTALVCPICEKQADVKSITRSDESVRFHLFCRGCDAAIQLDAFHPPRMIAPDSQDEEGKT